MVERIFLKKLCFFKSKLSKMIFKKNDTIKFDLVICNLIFLKIFSYNLGTADSIVGFVSFISFNNLSIELQK